MTANPAKFPIISFPAMCLPKLISFIEVNCPALVTVWCLLRSHGRMGNRKEIGSKSSQIKNEQ